MSGKNKQPMTDAMKQEIEAAKAEVLHTYNQFRAAFSTALERAVDNGKAVIKLHALCAKAKAKKQFEDMVKELGIPLSTAYAHRDVALDWEKCQKAIAMSGVELELKTIREVIAFANPPKELQEGGAEKEKTKGKTVEFWAKHKPAGTDEKNETSIKDILTKMYEGKAVNIIYPKKNQKIDLQLTGGIVVIIPVE